MDISTYMISKTIFVIILITIIFIYYIIKSKKNDSKKAEEFIDGLYDTLKEEILDIISNIDAEDFSTFDEFKDNIISSIFSRLKEYILNIVKEEKGSIISIAVSKIIENESFIEEAIEKIINHYAVDEKINSIWVKKLEKTSKSISEEDEKLQKEFSDESKYIESITNNELSDATVDTPAQEELDKLNPQIDISDSDINYDPESDDSVELLEDNTFIDANGRKRSKSTGRFVKE